MHGPADVPATIHYLDGSFQVLRPGNHVTCAVTGKRIALEDLRYWSVTRQEAYIDAWAVLAASSRRGAP